MKKLLIILAMLVMTIAMVGMVEGRSAAFLTPQSSGNVVGSTYNVTIFSNMVGGKPNGGLRYCNITVTSTLTGASTSIQLWNGTGGNESNLTVSNASTTYDSRSYQDANDYVFAGTCYNATLGSVTLNSSSSVVVDNAVPNCTFSSATVSSGTYARDQTFTINGSGSTRATLRFGSNAPFNMVKVNSKYTYSGKVPEGYYTITGTTTDETNQTQCTLTNVKISEKTTAKQVGAFAATKKGSGGDISVSGSNKTNKIIMYGGIALVGWLLWKRKK